MGTDKIKTGFIILIFPFLLASSCKKEGTIPCRNAGYSFNVKASVAPEKEIYKVGDTMFIESKLFKNLYDLKTSSNINYNNSVGIYCNFNTLEIDTIQHVGKETLNKFSVLATVGEISPSANTPNLGVSVKYFEDTQFYEVSLRIILIQKGLFYVGFTDPASQGIRGKNCTNASFNMTVTNPNKHLDLFQYGIGYAPDAYLAQHIYCFRVN